MTTVCTSNIVFLVLFLVSDHRCSLSQHVHEAHTVLICGLTVVLLCKLCGVSFQIRHWGIMLTYAIPALLVKPYAQYYVVSSPDPTLSRGEAVW